MLKLRPSDRPSAQSILDEHVVDYSRTMVKSNSNPSLLKTIVCPRDMLRLKAMLPEKRYRKCSDAEKLPSVNVSRNENQKVQIKNPKLGQYIKGDENNYDKEYKVEISIVKEKDNKLKENKNCVNVAPKPKEVINLQPKNNAVNGRPVSKLQQQRPGSPSSNYDLPVHERLNRRPDSGKEAAAKRDIDAIIAKARCRPGSPNRPNSPNYQNRDVYGKRV